MATDGLGDRMKMYEAREAQRRFMPLLPVVARIDGRSFSTFTQPLRRPFDERLSKLMIETTRFLVDETVALAGFTQSDEISLLWCAPDAKSQIFFEGRIQKMTSVLAASATAFFNKHLAAAIPEVAERLPVFDCRVWTLPSREEAANVFLWREIDASKNSVSMAARALFSHRDIDKKNSREMQAMMLREHDVNWNDYPAFFKRGTFVVRRKTARAFTAEELARLPPKHEAHEDPDLVIERTEIVDVDMPPFGRVTNRVAVLFEGAEPVTSSAPASDL